MASKNISISESAYKRLKALKEDKESFTDAINRLTREKSLSRIEGILTDEEAEELEDHIREAREDSRKRMDRIAEAIDE